jgi:hypothetical protein
MRLISALCSLALDLVSWRSRTMAHERVLAPAYIASTGVRNDESMRQGTLIVADQRPIAVRYAVSPSLCPASSGVALYLTCRQERFAVLNLWT